MGDSSFSRCSCALLSANGAVGGRLGGALGTAPFEELAPGHWTTIVDEFVADGPPAFRGPTIARSARPGFKPIHGSTSSSAGSELSASLPAASSRAPHVRSARFRIHPAGLGKLGISSRLSPDGWWIPNRDLKGGDPECDMAIPIHGRHLRQEIRPVRHRRHESLRREKPERAPERSALRCPSGRCVGRSALVYIPP